MSSNTNTSFIQSLNFELTTYSKTNVSVSRVCTMSCKVTTLLCFSSFNNDASRIAVKGAPSSS